MKFFKINNHFMKAKLVLLFALVARLAGAAETQPPTVAVYDFVGVANAKGDGPKVTALVTADLAANTNFVLVERAQLSRALNEQAFGVSGMVSSDAAAKIGKITGAKILVAGQVIRTGQNDLTIVANIIGTETGRLYADKVEGTAENLSQLTSDLSKKISQTITEQATNLVTAEPESQAERLERIVSSVTGTNRPSVSVDIRWPSGKGNSAAAQTEFGIILLKAGFPVVDASSDRKPDVEITGVLDFSAGPRRGGLFTFRSVLDVKVQERRTGNILGFEHKEGSAIDASKAGANRASQVNAVDASAEKVLALLAK